MASALIFAAVSAAEPMTGDFAARASLNGTVRRAENRDRKLGVIELFYAAYDFCEIGRHLDKLDRLSLTSDSAEEPK